MYLKRRIPNVMVRYLLNLSAILVAIFQKATTSWCTKVHGDPVEYLAGVMDSPNMSRANNAVPAY